MQGSGSALDSSSPSACFLEYTVSIELGNTSCKRRRGHRKVENNRHVKLKKLWYNREVRPNNARAQLDGKWFG
jgi:hypothetical protein